MWKAAKSLEAHAQRSIEDLGICTSDFAVLEALLHKGPLPVNVIGKKVLLTSGSMTAAIDRLERRGLVERGQDAQDRRTRIVHLTNAGHKLIRKHFAEHERDMERAVSSLSAEERTSLVGLLRKLGPAAEALLEADAPQARLDKKGNVKV